MNAQKKTARIAGLFYLLMTITGAYDTAWVPSHLIVKGNAAATAEKVLANEYILRTGIVSQLLANIFFLLLVLYLYRLFKKVNERQAKLMLTLVLVQVPIAVLIEVFKITPLMILDGETMKTLGPVQKQDVAMLFFDIHGYAVSILEIFWGLWLIPFGRLVYKSGFIPKIFGILLIIGSIGYITESLRFLLFPTYHSFVTDYIGVSYAVGELSIMLWLLIKGIKPELKGESARNGVAS